MAPSVIKHGAAVRCAGLGLLSFVALCAAAAPTWAAADTAAAPSADARMQAPGSEADALARRTGVWDVVATFRLTPDAAPVVSRGVIAERKMVGLFLEEVMRPAPGSDTADFRRVAYLTYSKVEGRWQYVSLDTRLPVGIMPATSFGQETNGELTFQFEPLGFVGSGSEVGGTMMRSNLVLTSDGDDRETSRQYFIAADGTGREWLAVQYDYTRRH
jgi:hypothetical protein